MNYFGRKNASSIFVSTMSSSTGNVLPNYGRDNSWVSNPAIVPSPMGSGSYPAQSATINVSKTAGTIPPKPHCHCSAVQPSTQPTPLVEVTLNNPTSNIDEKVKLLEVPLNSADDEPKKS